MKKATETVKKSTSPSQVVKTAVKAVCDLCGGRGLLDSNTLCASCGGSGSI